jgi:undecaprenyl-diphosphatase
MEQRVEIMTLGNSIQTPSMLERIQALDEKIIRAVVTGRPQEKRHPINRLMRTLTRIGDADTWTLTLAILFFLGGQWRDAFYTRTPALLATLALTHVLKRIVRRKRPSVKIPGLAPLLGNPDAFSFPSSHSACAWAACLGIGLHVPTLLFPAVGLAAGISWSRLHVGAHYLSDIIVGAAIGATMALWMS